jgi:Tfp pilus assembly protein PilO
MKAFLIKLQQYLRTRSTAEFKLPTLNRVRWTSRYWLRRLDFPGVFAIGILAICPAFYFSTVRPEQARLELARESVAVLNEQFQLGGKTANGKELSLDEQLAEYYRKFPAEESSPEWLEKLMAQAANNGLSLNDGDYKVTRDNVGKLVRYQMTLKIKGEFPQIRKFLTDLPTVLPVIALEDVRFERQKVADAVVESKIKLVLYLEQAP